MSEEQTLDMLIQIILSESDDEELDSTSRQLHRELHDNGLASISNISLSHAPVGTKGIDPVILGAISIAVAPTLLTKFFDFLHAWAMRREGRIIKIKMQNENGASIEIEVPITLSKAEVHEWIEVTRETISKSKRKK